MSDFAAKLEAYLWRLQAMLEAKNEAYGNSYAEPVRIFSQSSPLEQLLVRIDDKLSRISRGHEAGEDTVRDLIGYLILYDMERTEQNVR